MICPAIVPPVICAILASPEASEISVSLPLASNVPAVIDNAPFRLWGVDTVIVAVEPPLEVMLLKTVLALPKMDWFTGPLNSTVPVPELKVPLLVKSPAILSEVVVGAVRVPETVMLAKLVDDPAMEDE